MSEHEPLLGQSSTESINSAAAAVVNRNRRQNGSDDNIVELDPDVHQPKCKWLLEPAVIMICISLTTLTAVVPQYVYYRVSLQYNSTANVTRAFVCDPDAASNSSEAKLTEQIQETASTWSMYRNTFISGIALFMVPLFGSSSDFFGRKLPILLPTIGILADAVGCLLVVLFELPLVVLVVTGALSSLFGGFSTFLAGTFAYLAEITSKESRALRIGILESAIGATVFAMHLLMGWFIRLSGYFYPLLFGCVCLLLNLMYIIVLIPEIRRAFQVPPAIQLMLLPWKNVLNLFRISSRLTVTLVLLLVSLLFYCTGAIGVSAVDTVYEMNLPFCFDSVGVGYLSSGRTLLSQAGVYIGILILKRWLPLHFLILLGLSSSASSKILTAFATSRTTLYIAAGAGSFSSLTMPIYRAHMSRLMPSSKQGAIFSCISVLEVGGSFVGIAAMLNIYKASIIFMPGFVYIVAAGFVAVAIVLTAASYWSETAFNSEGQNNDHVNSE